MEKERRKWCREWIGRLAAVACLAMGGASRALEVRVEPGADGAPDRVRLELDEGETVYAQSVALLAFSAAADDPEGRLPVREVPVELPEPDVPPDDWHPTAAYGRSFAFEIPRAAAGERLSLRLQRCVEEKCFLPETFPLESEEGADEPAAAADGAGAWREVRRWTGYATEEEFRAFLSGEATDAKSGAGGAEGEPVPVEKSSGRGFVWALLAAVAGGLLLNLSPCVLPMIPVNLAILGAGAKSGWGRGRRGVLGAAYGAGMAVAYGGAGAAVVLTGGVFGAFSRHPLFQGTVAVLLAALAVAMWRGTLDFSRFRPRKGSGGAAGGGPGYGAALAGAVAAGAVSALLAGACVAPVLVATLALSASLYAEGMRAALLLPFALGAGMALPWPLLAAGMAALPRPGAWMGRLSRAFALAIGLLAAYHGWQAVRPWLAGGSADHDEFAALRLDLGNLPEGRTVDELVAECAAGRPVLLDFGASWCKACALMHRTTLPALARDGALDGIAWIRLEADDPSAPAAAGVLRRHQIVGFPTYILLENTGTIP